MFHNLFNYWLLALLLCCSTEGWAQSVDSIPADSGYPAVNESKLANTKWKYAYTTHAESNTVLHKAENGYVYYLYLKFDNTLEHFINGKFMKDYWKLNPGKNALYYNHRQVKWWSIAEFTDGTLVLEFKANTKSKYRYHFVRFDEDKKNKDVFQRDPNELPHVKVDGYSDAGKRYRPKAKLGKSRARVRKETRMAAKAKKEAEKTAPPPVFMKIELVGGGYSGGIDPVYSNYVVISTDGRVIKETRTEKRGTIKTKKNITRQQLEELVAFAEQKGFFTWNLNYPCTSQLCERRSQQDPYPMAMRLVITRGNQRKIVMVSIFGFDDRKIRYVNYPHDLELIVDGIQKLVN